MADGVELFEIMWKTPHPCEGRHRCTMRRNEDYAGKPTTLVGDRLNTTHGLARTLLFYTARPRVTSGSPSRVAECAMARNQPDFNRWLCLVRAEYLEMPGLQLTRAQVRRLWNLDGETTDALLDELVSRKFLRRTAREAYALAASEGPRTLNRRSAISGIRGTPLAVASREH
jgi:hypothetical protein